METTATLDNQTNQTTTSTPVPVPAASAPVLGCRMLKLPEAVNVTLTQGGRPLGFDLNGKVTDTIGLGSVELTVATPADYPIIGIHIDETTHIPQRLKNEGDDSTGSIFRKKIQIFRTEHGGKFFPDKTQNNIRWVDITQARMNKAGEPEEIGIVVTLFVASLVAQRGKFYLTYQVMVSAECFLVNGAIKIPEMRRSDTWRELGRMLETELSDLIGSLTFRERNMDELDVPKRNEYDHSVDSEVQGKTGVVLNYSLRRQYGAVRVQHPETGELVTARAYYANVCTERPDGLLYLIKGEKISWGGIEKPQQPRRDRTIAQDPRDLKTDDVQKPARKRTSYEWELKGVKVIA